MVTKYVEKDTISKTVTGRDSSKWKNQEENLKNEETIAESGRIFVRNLAYTISEDNIEQLFSKFGESAVIFYAVIDKCLNFQYTEETVHNVDSEHYETCCSCTFTTYITY